MKLFVLSVLVLVCYSEDIQRKAPKVMVYSRNPAEMDMDNVLICHVTEFHPPDITIQLMRGEEELKHANQTDLAFQKGWHFHLTRSAAFTPKTGEVYTCKVTHGSSVNKYTWEPNM